MAPLRDTGIFSVIYWDRPHKTGVFGGLAESGEDMPGVHRDWVKSQAGNRWMQRKS